MVIEPGARRCILVPIDLHGINRPTLETLVRIASLLDRSVLGLLLEDIRLQQVADLPFTTEITLSGARERNLLRDKLSQRHSEVATDTRRLLNELANRDRVELNFENAAGQRLHSVLERDGHLDVFFPARQRWQLAATARPSADKPIRRLGMVLAHTAQDPHVIETAHLLQQVGLVTEIYVISVGALDRAQLDRLYQPGSRICVQANLSCDPQSITRLIRQSAYDLLLMPRDSLRGIAPEALDAALDKSGGQVLLIN